MGKKRGGGGFHSFARGRARGSNRGGARKFSNHKQGYHANLASTSEEYDNGESSSFDPVGSVVYGMENMSMRVNDMVYYPPQPSFVEILDKYSILLGKTHRAAFTFIDETGLHFDLIVENSLSELNIQPSTVYSSRTPHPNSILDSMDSTTLTQIIGPPPYIVKVRMVWAELPLTLWEDLPLKMRKENVYKGFPIGTLSKVFVYKICQTCAYPHHKTNSHLHIPNLPPHEHTPLIRFAKSPYVRFPPLTKGLSISTDFSKFYSLGDKKKKLTLSSTDNTTTTTTTTTTPAITSEGTSVDSDGDGDGSKDKMKGSLRLSNYSQEFSLTNSRELKKSYSDNSISNLNDSVDLNSSLSGDISTTFDYFIIIDLEASCDYNPEPVVSAQTAEIIEFPWVVLEARTGLVLEEHQLYVRPNNMEGITRYCTALTGITKEMLLEEGVDDLRTVVKKFEDYLEKRFPLNDSNPATYCILCDGIWDLQIQLLRECKEKNIPLGNWFHFYFDLKIELGKYIGILPETYRPNLAQILYAFDLAIVGTHHRGIDDCKTIATVVRELLKRGHVFESPREIPTNSDYNPLKDEAFVDFGSVSAGGWLCESNSDSESHYSDESNSSSKEKEKGKGKGKDKNSDGDGVSPEKKDTVKKGCQLWNRPWMEACRFCGAPKPMTKRNAKPS